MSVPFFYEQNITEVNSLFALSEESSKHCIQVLRMKEGSLLHLTNGKGILFKACIVNEDKNKTVVQIMEVIPVPLAAKKISIAISLLKNASRFEWFLEKTTEIGVNEIQPLICSRTENTRFRYDRMNSIVISAMLQSQQTWLPLLHEPIVFRTCIQQTTFQQKLIAHCEDEKKRFIRDLPSSNNSQLLIGPEGDFTPEEIGLALQNNYVSVSLGETRLRSETAGVVASALLMNQ